MNGHCAGTATPALLDDRTAAVKGQDRRFDLASALSAAANDQIEDWVHAYLNGPGRNPVFSEGLRRRRRFWRGPLPVPLTILERTCGPEPGLPFVVPVESWTRRIAEIMASFESMESFPPLLVQYEAGRFLIRDGSHRFGAFEKLARQTCWVILWYADEAAFESHEKHEFRI
jgi:hypothetical protein